MGTANQQPSPNLNDTLTGLGVAPSTLSGGAYGDPDDLPVFMRRFEGGPRRVIGPGPAPQFATTQTRRQSELESDFYRMESTDLSALQHRLWAGGFYAQSVDENEVALGDYDEQTFAAYQKAVQRAARFYAAGQEFTVDDVIDMASGIGGEGGAGGRGRGAGGRTPLVTELTNPEDLRHYAQKTAVSTLGRALRPDELARFVTSFHGAQSTAQAGVGTVVQAPSPTTAAEAFARKAAPTEAGAHDFVKVYDVFSRLLSRRG